MKIINTIRNTSIPVLALACFGAMPKQAEAGSLLLTAGPTVATGRYYGYFPQTVSGSNPSVALASCVINQPVKVTSVAALFTFSADPNESGVTQEELARRVGQQYEWQVYRFDRLPVARPGSPSWQQVTSSQNKEVFQIPSNANWATPVGTLDAGDGQRVTVWNVQFLLGELGSISTTGTYGFLILPKCKDGVTPTAFALIMAKDVTIPGSEGFFCSTDPEQCGKASDLGLGDPAYSIYTSADLHLSMQGTSVKVTGANPYDMVKVQKSNDLLLWRDEYLYASSEGTVTYTSQSQQQNEFYRVVKPQ